MPAACGAMPTIDSPCSSTITTSPSGTSIMPGSRLTFLPARARAPLLYDEEDTEDLAAR